jgi:hypothetical protein
VGAADQHPSADRVVRPARRQPRHPQADGRLAGVLAQGWAPCGGGLQLSRSGSAPDADGVPAAGRQRRRANGSASTGSAAARST